MGLFDRVERKLERVVNGAFARAFKAEVQPVEIASAMRRAMDDRAAVVGRGHTVVPNVFAVELAPSDHDRLAQYSHVLQDELVASAQEHAESQGYSPGGPMFVEFFSKDDLETGVFRVRPSTSKDPRPRPKDRAYHARNEMWMPAATESPDGAVGLAGHAAAAAAGAVAGTAAAGRAGHRPDPDPPDPEPFDEDRHAQRQRDLAAWPEDDHPHHPDEHDAGDDARIDPAPRVERPSPPERERYEDYTPGPGRGGLLPPAQRPATRRPWLELGVDTYPLLGAITVLGRDHGVDVTLDDPGVSRRHCEIRVTHDGPHLLMSVRDLGSTNGTFVNGERVQTSRLVDGDRLTVGRTSLLVRAGGR